MRTDEMADILIDFGVDQAINLDGGGSTTLVFADGPAGAPRTINSPSDGGSGQQAGDERSVANHFGIFATPNPAYTPLVTPPRPGGYDPLLTGLTVLDGFNGGEGRFASAPFGGSGSTNGITAASAAVYAASQGQAGVGGQQITLVRNQNSTARLRHLSGSGSPGNNRVSIGGEDHAMGVQGFVGFFLRTTEADLEVGIGIDDGFALGGAGLEESSRLPVIADGKWHLYEWNLADASQWTNFLGGNGTIGGPNAYVDSLFFYSGASTVGVTFTMFVDTVAYNPHGSLASLAAPSEAGDFDLDGDVDRFDLAKWEGDFGATTFSDADNDGDSDGADFLAWQRGLDAPAATPVPEPASMCPACLAVLFLLVRRASVRRRRLPSS
jgi:hypothetical protein